MIYMIYDTIRYGMIRYDMIYDRINDTIRYDMIRDML
jgi:hypothetical protein